MVYDSRYLDKRPFTTDDDPSTSQWILKGAFPRLRDSALSARIPLASDHTRPFSPSCFALGTIFGATFQIPRPRPRPAPTHCPKAVERELSAGGGAESKKVAPKLIPRARRDVEGAVPMANES